MSPRPYDRRMSRLLDRTASRTRRGNRSSPLSQKSPPNRQPVKRNIARRGGGLKFARSNPQDKLVLTQIILQSLIAFMNAELALGSAKWQVEATMDALNMASQQRVCCQGLDQLTSMACWRNAGHRIHVFSGSFVFVNVPLFSDQTFHISSRSNCTPSNPVVIVTASAGFRRSPTRSVFINVSRMLQLPWFFTFLTRISINARRPRQRLRPRR